MTLQFELLGPLQVRCQDNYVVINGPRQRALLIHLLLAAGRVVAVDALSEAIWGEHPPPSARTQVAICIAGIRKALRATGHDDIIWTVHPGYRLAPGGHHIDLLEFEDGLRKARLAVNNDHLADAAVLLSEALALWRGRPLADAGGHKVESEAARLEEQRLLAMEQLASVRLDLGDHTTVIGALMPVVRQHPLREQARAHLMLAQYRSGQRAEALATFREGRQHSIDELGLEPGPRLLELNDAILRDDRVIGRTAVDPRSVPTPRQLPANVAHFVGRGTEQDELKTLATERSRDQAVMVGVINGMAGAGKTALALRWAHSNADAFPDGQLFADLKGFSADRPPCSPDDVLERFLHALGVSSAQVPPEPSQRQALYHTVLNGRRLLIVLDNAHSFTQLHPLLPGSGTCCVLVTSRRPFDELQAQATVRLRLGPLQDHEAVELLDKVIGDDRVSADPLGANAIASLCDRLPLALRIAGARLASRPHWTLQQLVNRLDDPRQRLDELSSRDGGLRTSFGLSYRELGPVLQTTYRRLAQMAVPTFDVRAGAAQFGTTVTEAENLLESLVDAGLVTVVGPGADGQTQYGLHGLSRLFATELGPGE